MSYREIPEDKILKFPATPGFKGWETFFTSDSTTHPAKMCLNLLRWILETYTKPGEIVLDPMAGTGSTIVLASLLGRHGVAVEYEPRFCDMIRENIKLAERQTTLTPKGRIVCIQGDARELSHLLNESDTIVTSPPFGPSTKGGGIFREGYKAPGEEEVSDPGLPERHSRSLSDDPRNIDNLEYGEVDAVVTSPPYSLTREGSDRIATGIDVKTGKSLWSKTGSEFSEGNIQKLPHGDVNAVITSPPYEGSVPAYDEGWLKEHWDDESASPKHKTMRFGRSMRGYPKKVDSVVTSPPYGNRLADDVVQDGDEARISYRQAIDSIVTSPPYEEAMGKKHHSPRADKIAAEKNIGMSYTGRANTIVTSPPYEGMLGHSKVDLEREASAMETDTRPDTKHRHTPGRMRAIKAMVEGYPASEDNIGNLKSESYLEAMLQVFRECYKVLKNKGVMVLVTKNFIRDKQVVRLDEDTIKLCEAAGFTLRDRWYFKLPQRSFWRILYKRRYPGVPEVKYEDVIVFSK